MLEGTDKKVVCNQRGVKEFNLHYGVKPIHPTETVYAFSKDPTISHSFGGMGTDAHYKHSGTHTAHLLLENQKDALFLEAEEN